MSVRFNKKMKSRLKKKRNKYLRVRWLACNIETVERGYLVDYFRHYPGDLREFRRQKIDRDYYLNHLLIDIKNNYRHPGYDKEISKNTLEHLRYGDYSEMDRQLYRAFPEKYERGWIVKAEFKV